MDIRHLEYFVEVVNSKCNLSAASKKLCISQPALSALIRNFEEGENLRLFERYNGRLQNLTNSGEIFYKNAVEIVANYQTMMSDLRESSVSYKGRIKIGIPPLISSVAFFDLIPNMILDNPDIKFDIVELGAFELKKMLLSNSLDFAVLLQPIDISPGVTNEFLLYTGELTAFMAADNPLAVHEKLAWSQLNGQPMAIFNSDFMIHHHLMDKFHVQNVRPKIAVTSANWDFLLLSTKRTNLLTVLPSPIHNLLNIQGIVERKFHDPIPWRIALHQPIKNRYSRLEKYVLKIMLDHFGK
ncbi:MAG: LysR family transcriptional regulator [Oscillospiraceae bacterium]|nr:LysR family transcriptional regulator [Oscillospiraceae bacterium]